MAMLAAIHGRPLFVVIAGCAYVAYRLLYFLRIERIEERRRREQGQPHTNRDTALLILTALTVVGILLCTIFFIPSNSVFNSRAGFAAIIIFVGGGLTYVFNRKGAPHS
jgi:sterol desaturase/sphingolipid hydroxylase (fatty acid hydroxylase superfamily)